MTWVGVGVDLGIAVWGAASLMLLGVAARKWEPRKNQSVVDLAERRRRHPSGERRRCVVPQLTLTDTRQRALQLALAIVEQTLQYQSLNWEDRIAIAELRLELDRAAKAEVHA